MVQLICPVDEHPMTLISGQFAGQQDCFADMLCPSGQHLILNNANQQTCANNPVVTPLPTVLPTPTITPSFLTSVTDYAKANPVIVLGGIAVLIYLITKK